jgi:hypothetical protein
VTSDELNSTAVKPKTKVLRKVAVAAIVLVAASLIIFQQREERRQKLRQESARLAYIEMYPLVLANDFDPILARVNADHRAEIRQSLVAFRREFMEGMYPPSEIVGVTLDGPNLERAAMQFPAEATGIGNSVILENNGRGWYLLTIGMWSTEAFNKGLE